MRLSSSGLGLRNSYTVRKILYLKKLERSESQGYFDTSVRIRYLPSGELDKWISQLFQTQSLQMHPIRGSRSNFQTISSQWLLNRHSVHKYRGEKLPSRGCKHVQEHPSPKINNWVTIGKTCKI